MLYESYFHLRENPFGLTPNPRFSYKSRSHKDALAYLAYGIFGKKGFLALTGEVGVGKTTVVRAFVGTFQPCLEVAFVLNTKVNFPELLYMFLHDFGCPIKGNSKVELLSTLNEFLIRSYAENANPVLIIDEAQNLEPEVLEELRMLSNLETDNQKLIQIVLVGQPELEVTLARRELRQLRQRIPSIHRLGSLTEEEVGNYINYRLSKAGLVNGSVAFNPDANRVIFGYTSGIPRLVNLVCDRILCFGYLNKVRTIDGSVVKASMKELEISLESEEDTVGGGKA